MNSTLIPSTPPPIPTSPNFLNGGFFNRGDQQQFPTQTPNLQPQLEQFTNQQIFVSQTQAPAFNQVVQSGQQGINQNFPSPTLNELY
ncbi:unnamed protein product [Caenorhabditis angaria]|uniref:Uncharacterized protein n=1 Tax=Caenorhabditis angaria TaxID=860376 RepID=A0A9P1I3D1_9PELO|nr:unnamed protein product [Caenorhabditis angaria]